MGHPCKPGDDVHAMLVKKESSEADASAKWLKDLINGRGEERLDKWIVCVKEHLGLFKINFVDS